MMEPRADNIPDEYRLIFNEEERLRIFNPTSPETSNIGQDLTAIVQGLERGELSAGRTALPRRYDGTVRNLLPRDIKDLRTQYRVSRDLEPSFQPQFAEGVAFARGLLNRTPQYLFTLRNLFSDYNYALSNNIPHEAAITTTYSTKDYVHSTVTISEDETRGHSRSPQEVRPWVGYYGFLSGVREVLATTGRIFEETVPPANAILDHIGITDARREPSREQFAQLQVCSDVSMKLGLLAGLVELATTRVEEAGNGRAGETVEAIDDYLLRHEQTGAHHQMKTQVNDRLFRAVWDMNQIHRRLFHGGDVNLMDPQYVRAYLVASAANADPVPLGLISEVGNHIFHNHPLYPDFYDGNKFAEEAEKERRDKFLRATHPQFWKDYAYLWAMQTTESPFDKYFQEIRDRYMRQFDFKEEKAVMEAGPNGDYVLPEDPARRVGHVLAETDRRFDLREAWEGFLVFDDTDKRLLIAHAILSPTELGSYLEEESNRIFDQIRSEGEFKKTKENVRVYVLNVLGWQDLYTADGRPNLNRFTGELPFWLSGIDREASINGRVYWEKIARFLKHYQLLSPQEEDLLGVTIKALQRY